MSNYLSVRELSDVLGSGIQRTTKGLRLPATAHEQQNLVLPPSAQTLRGLADSWGGVTALDEFGSSMLVREGNYVSGSWGGLFRVYVPAGRGRSGKVVGARGPVFGRGREEGDAVFTK